MVLALVLPPAAVAYVDGGLGTKAGISCLMTSVCYPVAVGHALTTVWVWMREGSLERREKRAVREEMKRVRREWRRMPSGTYAVPKTSVLFGMDLD